LIIDAGYDGAGNGDELRSNDVHAVVVELLFIESLPGEAELQDGDAGGGEVNDLRREDAGGKILEHLLGRGGDLGVGGVERGARLEVDFDDVFAVEASGFDVLDVVDEGGKGPLVGAGDAAFDFFGAEAGVLPGDRDDGDIDVGEDVRGGPQDQHRRRDQDQDREDNEGIGPVKREANNPHEALSKGKDSPCMTVKENEKTRLRFDNRTVCAKNAERVMQGFEGGKWRIGREDFGAPGGDRTHEYWFCRPAR
jgi:hypothetical protein